MGSCSCMRKEEKPGNEIEFYKIKDLGTKIRLNTRL